MNRFVLLLLGLFFSTGLLAQTAAIKGSIYDENNLPMPGASITIEGSNIGTSSDINGNFALLGVPVNTAEIKVSFIGYSSQMIKVSLQAGATQSLTINLEPATNELTEVVLIGTYKRGQAKAISLQKNNTNITNVVSSDQVGRFPDANIGDAMRRIPGVTMQNDQGEARDIIIRGMAPQLNSVMVNGERVPSAEGDNRRIQMDLIPADMIQTIEVNKSVTPDMDADAIGGAVNLVTRAAPGEQRISVTAASGLNLLSQEPIWTGAFVYGNRYLDNKLGLVVSGSYNDHDFGSDNVEAEWVQDDAGRVFVEDYQLRSYLVRRVRRSVSANLDYKIDGNNTIFFKSIYNWRDDWENRYRYRVTDIEYDEGLGSFVGEAERETKGGLNSDRIQNRRLEDQRMWNYQLQGQHLWFNTLKVDWSANLAQASEERPNERYIVFKSDDVYPVQLNNDSRFPIALPTNPSQFDLNNLEFDELTEEYQYTFERDNNYRLDFELPLVSEGKYLSSLKFGGRYRGKTKERDNNFFEYDPINGIDPSSIGTIDMTDDGYLAGDQYEAGDFASPEYLGNLDLTDRNQFDEESVVADFAPGNYTASENISAAYVMLKQSFGPKLSAIAGVRLENTAIDYSGNRYIDSTDAVQAVSASQDYINVLPGLHLRYAQNDNSVFRFSLNQTLARPNYFDLVPFQEILTDDEEINLGNANLEAAVATNLDLNYEYYFKSIGLVSGGVFYKSIN
ncbi:MAG: TonB-dependent receptor, partial [Croceimicrobium sp.]